MRKALKKHEKMVKNQVYMPFRCKEMHEIEQDRIWHIMHSILKGDVVPQIQKLHRNRAIVLGRLCTVL
jgi:hypothetical protein